MRRPLLPLALLAAMCAPAAARAGLHLGGRPPVKPHHHHRQREAADAARQTAAAPAPAPTPPAAAGW